MEKYSFILAKNKDISKIASLYNSNPEFLEAHLGTRIITEEFTEKDFSEGQKQGFQTFLITNSQGDVVGFCNYRLGEETYLSLLLIDGGLKKRGIGRQAYAQLENSLRAEGACRMRIDVLYEYAESALEFWKKQDFLAIEKIAMDWENHKSIAIKMIKAL